VARERKGNGVGYHVLRMDPLHLQSGAQKQAYEHWPEQFTLFTRFTKRAIPSALFAQLTKGPR
jgi:hypothetical protein